MSKPDLPGSGDKPTGRNLGDLLPDDEDADIPDRLDDIGRHARRHDEDERPRREQMNLDIDDDIKRRFKDHIEEGRLQMRFVVEDLLRIYLNQIDGDS
jgi:hypothetical protein